MIDMPDNVAKVRQDQEREARKKLSPREGGFKRGEVVVVASGSSNRSVKKTFVAKGHDAILSKLQFSEDAEVLIQLVSGDKLIGKVVARDKFTITIAPRGENEVTIYKHAIEYFGKA